MHTFIKTKLIACIPSWSLEHLVDNWRSSGLEKQCTKETEQILEECNGLGTCGGEFPIPYKEF